MLSRRFLCWAVLALVLVVGGALGRDTQRIELTAPAAAAADHVRDGADGESPCVVRADCAGAGLFVGMGLLLAVAVAVPTLGVVVMAGRVRYRPLQLRSTLRAQRLLRPPQRSS